MKRTPTTKTSFDPTKDFLALPNKGRYARLIGPFQLPRPARAFLDSDGYLSWTWYRQSARGKERLEEAGARRHPPKLQKPQSDLCFRFSQLSDGSDEHIRAFAERWGPLGIYDRAEEHIKEWRQCADLAAALLRFTAERASGGRGNPKDWKTICGSTIAGVIDRTGLPAAHQSAITALAVNTWFAKARGHQILGVSNGQLQVRPSASNLMGVLVTQIAHVMARSDELVICAGCKTPFRPKRPLSRGSRQYCARCRTRKVPQRDASRDWRRRAQSPKP